MKTGQKIKYKMKASNKEKSEFETLYFWWVDQFAFKDIPISCFEPFEFTLEI